MIERPEAGTYFRERLTDGPVSRDARDAVIEAFADGENALLTRVAEMTTERDAYRLVALEAVARLHEQHIELTRLRTRLKALRDELRRHTTAAVLERWRAA
jgi:enoyl reductase-like protein